MSYIAVSDAQVRHFTVVSFGSSCSYRSLLTSPRLLLLCDRRRIQLRDLSSFCRSVSMDQYYHGYIHCLLDIRALPQQSSLSHTGYSLYASDTSAPSAKSPLSSSLANENPPPELPIDSMETDTLHVVNGDHPAIQFPRCQDIRL